MAHPEETQIQEVPRPVLTKPWHTEERQRLQDQAYEFARDEVLPVANELDPQKGLMPQRLVDRLGELGYFGLTIPREYGGLGLGVFEYCMVSEELARAWMSVGSIIARGQGAATNVGDVDRRAELLRRSARGQWIAGIGFSEPDAGSDLANVQCRAEFDGDAWVITGKKRWIGNSLNADCIQLLARERLPEPDEPRSAGLVTLLVEKERGAFPEGLSGTVIDKIGYHGFQTFELTFDGLQVPVENVLRSNAQPKEADPTAGSADHRAFQDTQLWLNIARVQTAARAVGLARAAVEDSTRYLQERVQFGRPIGDFQALRFELADMAAKTEQARAFYRQVAHLLDEGVPCQREAAMVKLEATEMAVHVTSRAMQLHGGNGYTTERQVERHWRDARLTTIFEGTSEIQKRTISNIMLPRPR